MTEFTKAKISFALALLGTLFVLHPFVERYGNEGYDYLNYRLKIFYAYGLVVGLIAFTVYCYALALLSERPHSWAEKTGNYAYALALMVPPLYGGLYLASRLTGRLEFSRWAQAAPKVALAILVGALFLALLLAWLLRKRMGEQDQTAKIEQLAGQEIAALERARELFSQQHYDLSVIEAWKAIEARLRRVLLKRGVANPGDEPQAMIRKARRIGLLGDPGVKLIQHLREQWNIAVSTDPLTREGAETALSAARDILATIPVNGTAKATGPVI
ncbi:MAG TPA: hypothetical protein VG013_15290 [Gemmataceae bacterium]|nr:hypothetical protein [Gemmataceae bacterium]